MIFDVGPLACLNASGDEGRVDHIGPFRETPEEFHGPDHSWSGKVVARRIFLHDLDAQRAEFFLGI
jgi:hypothetical protein